MMKTPPEDFEVVPPGSGPRRANLSKDGLPVGGRVDDPLVAMLAKLLDSVFRIPGTNVRFGLDPIIAMIPGMGSPIASAASLVLIARSAQYQVPRIIIARMGLNVIINALLDAIPVIGGPLSLFYRSNAKNHALLQKHAGTQQAVSGGDKAFVFGMVAGLILIVGLILSLVAAVVWRGFGALMGWW